VQAALDANQAKKLNATMRHRQVLVAYLSDPLNEFPPRTKYPGICKISRPTLYSHFSPNDLLDIENEAFENRKAMFVKERAEVYQALIRSARGYTIPHDHVFTYKGKPIIVKGMKHYPPNPVSAREFLDRIEGKVVQKTEHTGKDGEPLIPKLPDVDLSILTDDELALLEKIGITGGTSAKDR